MARRASGASSSTWFAPSRKAKSPAPPWFGFTAAAGGGNKASGLGRLGGLAASGDFVGFSVGYRLTDGTAWPGQIHDCKAAIRWIRANAKMYGVDPEKIAVWGSSAGGHLVSMLGTSGDVKELEGNQRQPRLFEPGDVRGRFLRPQRFSGLRRIGA